jgi:uncharacterized protein (TIGR02246 family)
MSLTVVKEIEARWNAAASPWDPRALARLYTDDAVFFGLLPTFYVGPAEIQRYFAASSDTQRSVSLNLVDQQVRAIGQSSLATQGFGDIISYRTSGDVVPIRLRTSLVIVKNDGEWKIMLHHFSEVPPAH